MASFKSLLSKGLLTLKDFISGLSKGILHREGSTQQTIKSDAYIALPATGGKKHKKTPFWLPNKKPVKIKLRTRGTKGFTYAWKARLKAKARTKAKASIHITGIHRASTGFLALILGIKSFNVAARVVLYGVKRFVSGIYAIIIGKSRARIWHQHRVTGVIRSVTGIREAIKGTKRFKAALSSSALGTKSIKKYYKLLAKGDVKGILTKYFKVNGKRNITKILYALGLLDKVEKKR